MKVLWITNNIFPDLSKALGNEIPVVGGWMYGLANDLVSRGIDLTVATADRHVNQYTGKINGVSYLLLKSKKSLTEYDASLVLQWKNLIEEKKPDVVHIHGTEKALGLSLLTAEPKLNYVVSIQGLISVCSRYYTGGIPNSELKKHTTFRDIIKQDTILQAKRKFQKRGDLVEKKYFELAQNFIGRTQWDFDHTKTLNPNATYHFCNESLRDSFYSSKKWDIKKIQNHTIFLSQALYPIKGLHQVIAAAALLKNEFPNLKLRVAGHNIITSSTLKDKIATGGYGSYIRHLIRKFDLKNNIEFTGLLSENQMVTEYLNCSVFICPSSIENSPNSLGEAQLLGTPCIASYSGGIPSMIEHERTGLLYRFEEVEMMAQLIKRVFKDKVLSQKLSKNGIEAASKRHNREVNTSKTLEIYQLVSSSK
ncbi:glycosyltransferase family 4 protein [Maribacter algarum]|uniref:Glycosyltransferase family 4 protein n=1 Tax=Maribacter algarum (ex Zhang et al. 2020) TaxID=2578118 RepID=A0A5S3PHQ5_9FLAO|nr:glycosyltransferase family 4 protein [Maribacter algarum]TMM53789.1 glycosyltransferase family 4 protein [Maribacter algarum]